MKKLFLILLVTILTVVSFAITELKEIKLNINPDQYPKLKDVFEEFDIKQGASVGEPDIILAIEKINNLGLFDKVDYKFDEDNGVLVFDFSTSQKISEVKILFTDKNITPTLEASMIQQINKNLAENKIIKGERYNKEKNTQILTLNNLANLTVKNIEFTNEGILNITIKLNPIVTDVKIKILGDKLLPEDTILKTLNPEKDRPVNLTTVQDNIKLIQSQYNGKGYPYIDVVTNLNFTSEGITIDATKVNNEMVSNSTIVYVIKEICLWDIDFVDEYSTLNKEEIKSKLNFEFRKDYNNKFFLFRGKVEDTYPSVPKIQGIIQNLRQFPYFGLEMKIDTEMVSSADVPGGAFKLIIGGKITKVVDKSVTVKKINFKGNKVIETAKLEEAALKQIKQDAENTNDMILKGLYNVNSLYKDNGYILVNIVPSFDTVSQTLNFDIVEKKFGKIEVTKEATAKTKDYIVNSFNKITSGEVINQKKFQDTYTLFVGSGFYSSVDFVPTGESTDTVDFRIKPIENTKNGRFQGGVTYTPQTVKPWYEGISGNITLQWPNVFGYGDTWSINTEFTPFKGKYVFGLGYDIKKLFETDLNIGTKFDYALYTTPVQDDVIGELIRSKITFNVSPSINISDFMYITSFAGYDNYTKTKDATDTGVNVNRVSASLGYLYNTMDSPYRPYNGLYFSANTFGGFGGTTLFPPSQYYAGASVETKLFASISKFTFGMRGKIGYTEDVGDLWKFSVGNMFTVRGYSESRYGDKMFLGNAEIQYEITKSPMQIDGFVFFDVGNAQDNIGNILQDPLYSFGFGSKFIVPMFGQLGFYGYWDKTLNQSSNYQPKIGFSIGSTF